MATTDVIPYHMDGDTVTCITSAAVTGKRFVKISGARVNELYKVAHAAVSATVPVFGVAARDTASGANVTVFRPGSGILPVTAGGTLTAGAAVKPDANGKAVAAAAGDLCAGIALDDAASGDDARIDLRVFSIPA